MTSFQSTFGFIGAAAGMMAVVIASHSCSPTQQPTRDVRIEGAIAIDGDTFKLAGTHYRLSWSDSTYPDAPELPTHSCHTGQDCDHPAEAWQARNYLQQLLNAGVACDLLGTDRYQRTLADCVEPDGTDVGLDLISHGLAVTKHLRRHSR